jgi:hypothetical protein
LIKIEFNIGDVVLCKNDYKRKPYDYLNINTSFKRPKLFIKNNYYKIIFADYWDEEKKLIIYDIECNLKLYSFISTTETQNLQLSIFEDYFYTKQEIRKMKIFKIQGNERN